jgi:hypothetical protein
MSVTRPMLHSPRRQQLVDFLLENPRLQAFELANLLDCSPQRVGQLARALRIKLAGSHRRATASIPAHLRQDS